MNIVEQIEQLINPPVFPPSWEVYVLSILIFTLVFSLFTLGSSAPREGLLMGAVFSIFAFVIGILLFAEFNSDSEEAAKVTEDYITQKYDVESATIESSLSPLVDCEYGKDCPDIYVKLEDHKSEVFQYKISTTEDGKDIELFKVNNGGNSVPNPSEFLKK